MRATAWLGTVLSGILTLGASAGPEVEGVQSLRLEGGTAVVRIAESMRLEPSAIWIPGVPLPDAPAIDLVLEPFHVATEATRVVRGRLGGEDEPIAFDARGIVCYQGSAPGYEGSSVFLSIGPRTTIGTIDLGPGRGTYGISSKSGRTVELAPGEAAIFRRTDAGGSAMPSVPMCGLLDGLEGESVKVARAITHGQQVVEVAVETDYEYYTRFFDEAAAAEYMFQLYGAISQTYMREVNVRVVLTYVRIWTTPDDLFNEPDPLGPFREYWEANMDDVHRDVAMYESGRRNVPWGGVAYLNALCGDAGYSVVGYILGAFPEPDSPSLEHYDIFVTAHELGHNCGTLHTHDYRLDDCANSNTPARRGGYMSYCTQTVSGGNKVGDHRFETLGVRQDIVEHTFSVSCVADDCNQNDRLDAEDIFLGSSVDANDNGVPDECEDCNGNGVLDPFEIAQGQSTDLDLNGVPDECDPDCNGNLVPDALDIALGQSTDAYFNGIPDECEADCDGNGVSDYTQLQLDMTLDRDRNRVLDSCQDCDGDGTPDLVELDGSHDVWIASLNADAPVRRFFAGSGVLMDQTDASPLQAGGDVLITADRRMLVTNLTDGSVLEFDDAGGFVRVLVPAGSGGMVYPLFMAFGQAGELLVTDYFGDSVLAFDAGSGAFLRVLVASGGGGLSRPTGLALRDGKLYVADSLDRKVLEFNATTGAYVRDLVSGGSGGLSEPRGMVFLPDGKLLVCSMNTNQVLGYDGSTGAFLGQWNQGGAGNALRLDQPWGVRVGPDGHVYVSRSGLFRGAPSDEDEHEHGDHHDHDIIELHFTTARLYRFEVSTGLYLRAQVLGNDTGLYRPSGFDFMPDAGTDCNNNQRTDECDIASGSSEDRNNNGVPDECDPPCVADIDGNGVLNIFDFLAFQTAFSNEDPAADLAAPFGVFNIFDFLAFQTAFGNGC